MNYKKQSEKLIIWWKDKKLLIGFVLVLLSSVMGIFGKALFIIKFYKPFYLITGLSLYFFSWLMLFLGVFLVGLQTVKTMQQKIQHRVKKTAKETYSYTSKLPKRGYDYTKELHRKGIDKIKKSISKND